MKTATMTKVASIQYRDGWMLVISKATHAPMLFMEWLAWHRAAKCPIHSVIDADDYLQIRLNGTKQLVYESALKYINDNI